MFYNRFTASEADAYHLSHLFSLLLTHVIQQLQIQFSNLKTETTKHEYTHIHRVHRICSCHLPHVTHTHKCAHSGVIHGVWRVPVPILFGLGVTYRIPHFSLSGCLWKTNKRIHKINTTVQLMVTLTTQRMTLFYFLVRWCMFQISNNVMQIFDRNKSNLTNLVGF